jgi:hypothetical protein
VVAKEWNEVPAFYDHQFAVGQSSGVSGTRVTVQQGNFAKDLARVDDVEDQFSTICRQHADLYGSSEHPQKSDPGITLRENPGAAPRRLSLHARRELVEHRRGEFAE